MTFVGSDDSLDLANETALNQFLGANRIGSGNTVDLVIGPVQQGEGEIVVRRVDAVEAALARRGIAVDSINGTAETQPGRKLRAGDRFGPQGGGQWTITA